MAEGAEKCDGVDAEAKAIIEEIRQAFRGVKRGRITLHEAIAIDDYGSAAEREVARREDREDSWEEILDDDIRDGFWALAHFDAVSWRYYIAAYMIWTIRFSRQSSSPTGDFTIQSVCDCPPRRPELIGGPGDRHSLLCKQQVRAICRFLGYCQTHGDNGDQAGVERALKRFIEFEQRD